MLMSNEDAEEVWCPFGRQMITATSHSTGEVTAMAAVNRGSTKRTGTNCVANACMAWRWAGWATEFGTYAPTPAEENKVGPRLGYCGLAGKPFGAV